MDHAQLIQGFSDQTKVADAHLLVSVAELIPFLSISVCWFWFRLLQTREAEPKVRVTCKTKFAIFETV